MKQVTKETRSARKKQTAEVFTPIPLVNDILDKLSKECWTEEKTFCDPSAGNGNFLIEVLRRKIELGHDPLSALSTVYGVELMEDNVVECRHRLYMYIRDYLHSNEEKQKAVDILNKNIVCHDALTYDWEFK